MLYIVQAAHERGTVDIVDAYHEARWILYAAQCTIVHCACTHRDHEAWWILCALYIVRCACTHRVHEAWWILYALYIVHSACTHRDHKAWWMATGVSAECTPPTPLFPSQCRIAATWSTSLIS